MTNSFQSTAFQSSARPVDTFVQPVSVPETTGIMQLAKTLEVVNPNIQRFIGTRMEKTVELEKQKGAELVMQANQAELRQIIDRIKKKDGTDAAIQLIGGNIFTQSGVEKQLAINLGSVESSRAKAFFSNYTIEKELADGTFVKVPLSHFDINSSEFNQAIQEYSEISRSDISGIRSLYVNEFFVPQQSRALQEIYAEHIKNNNKYKVQRAENQLTSTFLTAYKDLDTNGKEASLEFMQSHIDNLEALGLTKVVSPTELKKLVVDQANSIFLIYENNNLDGYEAAMEYLELVGDLRVGLPQITKDGTTKQSLLKEFYDKDIIDLKIDLAEASEKQKERTLLKETRIQQNKIKEMIDKHSFVQINEDTGEKNYEVMQALVTAFPDQFEFIEEIIEEQDFSRDEFYTQFKFDIAKNKYTFEEAFVVLKNFELSLGVSKTEEDEIELQKLFNLAKEFKGKDILADYRSLIKQIHKDSRILANGTGEGNWIFPDKWMESGKNRLYLDAIDVFNRQILEIVTTTELKPGYSTLKEQHLAEIEIEKIKLFANVKKIVDGRYTEEGIIKEVDALLEKEGYFKEEEKEEEVTFESLEEEKEDKKGFFELTNKETTNNKNNLFPNLIPLNQTDLDSLIETNKLQQVIINKQPVYINSDDNKLYILKDNYKKLFKGIEFGGFSEVTQEDIDREKALDNEDNNIYTVKEGDTLIDLANKFNTTVKDIKDKNNLVDNTIYIDQELMMPIVEEQKLNTKIKKLKIKYSEDSRVQSIVKSANELGVRPIDLAAVIAQESSFRPDAVSVDPSTGDSYKGLIQFGPWEVKTYNFRDDMTFEEQMEIVVRFLKDRGVKPGHGVKEIYAAVFTGNVYNLNKEGGADREDSYGTTVNKALPNLIEGGSKYKMAIDFLQQKGPYLPE